jgi:thermopsin
MSAYGKLLLLVVAAIAATMVLPGVSALPIAGTVTTGPAASALATHTLSPASTNAPVPSSAGTSTSFAATGAAATQSRVLAGLKSSHVPMGDAFLPNFGAQVSTQGGHVQPLYTASPDPTGLGDFGVQDIGGHDVGTISYTSSVKASITLNSVDPLYVTSSAPDQFTMQLNTVETNVDLFGNDSYQFWIQNVPIYARSSQTLSFEDNIWNFSSPAFYFSSNSIYAHGPGGVVAAPELYYAQGPSFHVPTPFTVTVFNNATVVGGRSTVYFNYSVAPSTGPAFSGSYDFVEFNSTPAVTGAAPPPTFQINGKQVGDTDFLLNDAEIMIGGPGGGSDTTFFHISGSIGLWTQPNGTSTFVAVPSAYDTGTDTGETSDGIAEYATTGASPTAVLSSGPAILLPLWGLVGAHQGSEEISLMVSPSNAFVFASAGSHFNAATAAWAPTDVSGMDTYWLPPGTYSFHFLLSEYAPQSAVYSSSGSWMAMLSPKPSLGDYTPLWAQSNSQLAAISVPGGAGTVSNPYVLFNGPANVNPLFGEVNDYAWPVFPGIYFIDTSAYVDAYAMPSFTVTYSPAEILAGRLAVNGLPLTDQLNIELYHVSHVSLVRSDPSGWFFADLSFADPASVYLWNSSNNLIAGNIFYDESDGITAVNGGHNTIWGNEFVPTIAVAADPYAILYAGLTPGIWEWESHDLIFNNYFLTPITGAALPENFYNGAPQVNLDRWNVNVQPATDVFTVNGWYLSGSIIGTSWVGGNYWNNYGTAEDPYGVLPYDDGGLIANGGDYAPLIPFALYSITFDERGLPAGTFWWVTINGYTQITNGKSLVFWDPSGTYAYTVGWSSTNTLRHPVGAVQLITSDVTVHLRFH